LFFRFIGLFVNTDEKIILFTSLGKGYNDSPKAIFEKMIHSDEFANFKFVWALDDPKKYRIPHCEKIKIDTIKYFIYALKAKYWITCVNIERGLKFKKKNTIYLNTWHGIPMKTIGNAIKNRNDYDYSHIDIFCCASEYDKKIYSRDLRVRDEAFIYSGLPRNDILYNVTSKKVTDYKKKLGIQGNKKVILYAPTWRESWKEGYHIDKIDFHVWEKELHKDFILILRAHPYIKEITKIDFNTFIRDFTNYPEFAHLLIISDILITDYSSSIFDFSILERPIICFGYDYEIYKEERGFCLDPNTICPSKVLKNETEVLYYIKSMNYETECKKTKNLKRKYMKYGGEATEKTLASLKKFLND
jgi:CDP-glycerol glycerophosphotransferase